MRNYFVDTNTINAVESLFREKQCDPWSWKLAGDLADLFIYADFVRYPIPVRGPGRGYDLAQDSPLLRDLARRDAGLFHGVEYSTAEPRLLADQYLETCFAAFQDWARANRSTLHRWLVLHHSEWIRERWRATVGSSGYTFSLEKLLKNPDLEALERRLTLDRLDICYAFDSILKFPLYGELAGKKSNYLNHPIRDAFSLPTMKEEGGHLPCIGVSFKDSIAQLAPEVSQDHYTSLLHELRGLVREAGLHQVAPGSFDRETIREIAARVALPPRLRELGKVAAVAGGVIGGLGMIPLLGSAAAVAGAIVSVSAALWTGRLPISLARIKWMRWALKWDLEGQAENRA